ncbi:butyrophilin subfamily 2 member A2-like, partial [Tachysurus ichikawai]
PEPDVLWLDREGVTLTAEDTQRHRETELFTVKSRITVYDYRDSNRFYCRLQQQHHMMETEIIISSGVFGVWKWAVSISVVACLFLVGLILTGIFSYKKEQLQVVGPEAPLVAVAGEDLVLPCFIKPNSSAVDMTVEWFKLYVEDSLVHLYRDHEDKNEGQAQSYRGRTSLFKEELQKGNTSLKLSDLRVSDEGEYKCLVEDKSWYDDITLHVIVEGKIHFCNEALNGECYN